MRAEEGPLADNVQTGIEAEEGKPRVRKGESSSPHLRFCSFCGFPVDEGQASCSNCGAKFSKPVRLSLSRAPVANPPVAQHVKLPAQKSTPVMKEWTKTKKNLRDFL